ncbi:Alpha/beta hydrolase family protein [Pirellula sp. SH-Sr6A]|uniref:alpha/beta hydrolase family protein n=1 Tax=Pirellula sp. SH-Sr6A TaxID=1632865 RepID=UPI00078C9369|nr:dienelactone hydrolase family protein [Pirellula sp. SH-Sr6A]AMV34999.1 Alpha/beta hydrolase family protein [Pirellula sp. SH-Sr6A]
MRKAKLLFGLLGFLIPPCETSRSSAQDVSWLADVQVAIPAVQNGASKPLPTLAPIPSLSSEDDFKRFRERTLRDWQRYLGAFDLSDARTPPAMEVLETERVDEGLLRRLVRYETEPGQFVEAYILAREDLPSFSPAVVVFHSTVQHSIRQCVGLGDPNKGNAPTEDELRKAYALHLARRGFITFSPRNYLWIHNTKLDAVGEAKQFLSRNGDRKGMARMLYDSIRAVDALLSVEGVDPKRIGAVGHSLGAKEVLYLAAFDERIRASVSSEGGIGIAQSNWEADWYLGAPCKTPGFPRDHHQLVACIAPRPFLVIGGNASDGIESVPYLAAAKPAYEVFHAEKRLGLFNHGLGHAVPESSLERTIEWLETYLAE